MFGVQSWINMAVNLRAIPAKGMTLPFISYGGSSLLALGLGMGFLIALTRKRPQTDLGAQPSERGVSETRCILLAAGRHRRPSVSRRRARGGAGAARRRGRTRHRRSRAQIRRRFSRPRDPRHSLGDADRGRAAAARRRAALVLGARPRLGAGCCFAD